LGSLFDQDRSQGDQELVIEGLKLLEGSATGPELSEYHVEAAIAWVHARARRAEDTDWDTIVSLYDTLMTIRPSPIVALNRAFAVAQNEEIRSITDHDRLAAYPFYAAAPRRA
jgi:predicted RNA polymerase sigma factor